MKLYANISKAMHASHVKDKPNNALTANQRMTSVRKLVRYACQQEDPGFLIRLLEAARWTGTLRIQDDHEDQFSLMELINEFVEKRKRQKFIGALRKDIRNKNCTGLVTQTSIEHLLCFACSDKRKDTFFNILKAAGWNKEAYVQDLKGDKIWLLNEAVLNMCPAIVMELLDRGIDVSYLSSKEQVKELPCKSPLHEACRYNMCEVVQRLLEEGICPNLLWNGESPLMAALTVEFYPVACIKLLLEAGASPNIQSTLFGLSERSAYPLEIALENDYKSREIVSLLLQHKADVSLRCQLLGGHSFLAVCVNPCDIETLLCAGADVNTINSQKQTVVHAYASPSLHFAITIFDDTTPQLEMLSKAGAPIDSEDINGMTPLCLAAMIEWPELGSNVNINSRVKYLVSAGANLLHRSLLRHVYYKNPDCLRTILRIAEADPTSRSDGGRTGLHEFILKRYPSSLEQDAKNVEILNILLDYGFDPCIPDDNGWTALHYAAYVGDAALTRSLLHYGCDPNACDKRGRTPAHLVGNEMYLDDGEPAGDLDWFENIVFENNAVNEGGTLACPVKTQTRFYLLHSPRGYLVLEELVDHGAVLTVTDKNGVLPCALAFHGGTFCTKLVYKYLRCSVDKWFLQTRAQSLEI